MKTNQKCIIVLAALLAIALISTAAWAKKDQPPVPLPCGLTGTWVGDAEGSLAWLGIHTSTDGIKGEMLMNWVHNDLIGDAPNEMAPGHGVWELIDSDTGIYSYTWYSQAKFVIDPDAGTFEINPIRVYGTAQMQDCDNVIIDYKFEFQYEDANGELVWYLLDAGTAYETRLKVHTPELQ
ncbi:MAG: hypothetical protein R6T92_00755 [Desulfosalsimonadaceae bacterium]